MKLKYNIYIIGLILMGLLSSCNNFLDEQPYSEIPKDQMWQNAKDAKSGVNEIYGLYRLMMRENYWYWGEFRSDNFSKGAPSATDQDIVMTNSITSNHRASLWTSTYKVINQANLAIKYIPNINMPSVTIKNDYLGQAYAMRALAYFHAVRVWGDVPVYTKPIESFNDGEYKERTPADDVLRNLILEDLRMAETLILKSNKERKRISLYGVWAIMADVYMWLHEYQLAEQVIDKIGQDPKFIALEPNMDSWHTMLTVELNNKASDDNYLTDDYSSKELIFLIHYNMAEVGTEGYSYMYRWFTGSGNRVGVLSKQFMDKLNQREGDLRAPIIAMDYQDAWEMNKFINGVISTTLNKTCEVAYPIYRYSDMVLLKAEALARQNKGEEALDIVRQIRTRAGLTSTRPFDSFVDQNELVDYILDERQIELVGEGKRWYDLVRTNTWEKALKDINGMSDPRKVLYPVHHSHVDENPNVEQNPGY